MAATREPVKPNAAEALDRLQAMLDVPPASRPAEFSNPLEKIEELLTCAICLDRYRTPKLLPCQHTFCLEPCLEGLSDAVRRTVKCPECRAEHPLPYEGSKAFQTNYTLTGFLEVHLQANEDNAAEFEAYIRRYNMERCKVCDEKAEVEHCFHCDKRICLDCKASHVDLVKRDLARFMNQVKRLTNRVTEASDGLSKGVDSLMLNCNSAKEEVKDNVRRFMKDLKKKEDHLLKEIDEFCAFECRLMSSLRDSLELESSNINEACARVDAALKGERAACEEELVRYKQLFSDGLDFLRSFHPDSDDLFSKKLRFSMGQDQQQLAAVVANFGEILICSPQFGGRFHQLESAFAPRIIDLGAESDQRRAPARQAPPLTDSRGAYSRDEDVTSLRYRRRQQLEEEAWNRLRRPGEPRRSPRQQSPSRSQQAAPPPPLSARQTVEQSPWSQVTSISAEVSEADVATRPPVPPSRSPARMPRQGSSTEDVALNEKIENIRREHEQRLQQQKRGGGDPTQPSNKPRATALFRAPSKIPVMAPSADNSESDASEGEAASRRAAPPPAANDRAHAAEPIPVHHFPHSRSRARDSQPREDNPPSLDWKKYLIPHPSQEAKASRAPPAAGSSGGGGGAAGKQRGATFESAEEASWAERRKRFVRSKTNPELLTSASMSVVADTNANDSSSTAIGSGFRNRFIESLHSNRSETRNAAFEKRRRGFEGVSTEIEVATAAAAPADVAPVPSDRRSKYRRKTERSNTTVVPPPSASNSAAPRFEVSMGTPSNTAPVENEKNHFYRVFTSPKINYQEKCTGGAWRKFGVKGSGKGEFNWPRGVAIAPTSDELAVCDSSNHRVQVFNGRGQFVREFGAYGNGKGEFDCLAGIASTAFNQFVVTDRYNHRVQVFESSGRFVREFGSHGQTNGRFNNPWGVAVDNSGFIYIADKDNHRIQIFQADGNYVGKFGSIGSREGQFQNPHFIAVNRQNQLIVTDSSNHRVQVFDHNGHCLFAFGTEGFHDGQFKYPRGVAVDDQGFMVVADSGNNRVQVFYPDGRFYASFGSWGSGEGQMKGVEGIAITPDNRVVVTDRENHRVQVF